MLFSEVAVDPEVRLFLVVGLSRGPDKIVRASNVRERVALKHLKSERVETRRGNRVVEKLRPGRGCRIEDRLSKDSLSLRKRGNHTETRDTGPQSRPLPVREEECLVGLNRPADGQSVRLGTRTLALYTRRMQRIQRKFRWLQPLPTAPTPRSSTRWQS